MSRAGTGRRCSSPARSEGNCREGEDGRHPQPDEDALELVAREPETHRKDERHPCCGQEERPRTRLGSADGHAWYCAEYGFHHLSSRSMYIPCTGLYHVCAECVEIRYACHHGHRTRSA